jgi:histidine phosphotransferase ChpT
MEALPQTTAILATRVGARIVHDIAGAVQGLKAALALMEESGDPQEQAEARALAVASAADLEARLLFCRAAYGGAEPATAEELARLSQIPFTARRGRLRWAGNEAGAPPSLARAMLFFTQFAATALAGGGEALASLSRDSGEWLARVEASGEKLRLDPQALAAFTGAGSSATRGGRWVDGALVRALVLEAGGAVSVEDLGRSVILTARAPAGA